MKKIYLFLFFSLFLVSCGEKTKDVEYFYKNMEEAEGVAIECNKREKMDDNCKNAFEAVRRDSIDRMTSKGRYAK